MSESIEEQVKKIIASQLAVDAQSIDNSNAFAEDLGADSLDTVELVMALEEAFDMEIPDDDVEEMTTVQKVINYIEEHRKKK